MMSRTIIASPAAHSASSKPRVRQVGFETAVTAVIFAQKLKLAVARAQKRSVTTTAATLALPPVGRSRSKSISVRGAPADHSTPCRTVTTDGLLGIPVVKC